MSAFSKYLLILILFVPLMLGAQSDEIGKLKKEREKLEQEIRFTKKKITEIKSKKKSSMQSLVTLKKQLQTRRELIQNIERQIKAIDHEIRSKEEVIQALNDDLERLKKEYARLIYNTYIHGNHYDYLLFIFSAPTFNDAYNRLKYLKIYGEYREKQAAMIKESQARIQKEITAQEALRDEKKKLLKSELEQQELLAGEQEELSRQVKNFEHKEAYYRQEMTRKERAVRAIEGKIEELIAEAMKKKEKKSGAGGFALTPEAKALGASFESNKGKLPWPVAHGSITRNFGKRPHPVLPSQMITSLGIGISTNKEEPVRVVFPGTVEAIFYTPTYHRMVLVNHGTYFTAYGNLKSVSVVKQQKLDALQEIGSVYTDLETGESELEFQIWKSSGSKPVKLNPALWLYK